ncbi:MAG: DNA cytosine methyltransferase, partial [Candidatus Thorarchaeota archaeon]
VSDEWHIPLERLGVTDDISEWDCATKRDLIIRYGETHNSAEFRAPQARERFIAGNLDLKYIDSLKSSGSITMRKCIESLENQFSTENESIVDPNYTHHEIPRDSLRDYDYNPILHPMYWEDLRHIKQRHIQYGKITFPDDLDSPARTIMSTQNPSSRESIVFDTKKKKRYHGKLRPIFRSLRVREAACLQGFPIGYQFSGDSLNTRFRQIGNAVPCQLSYSLAIAILEAFNDSFEDDGQRNRFKETMKRRKANNFKPIIKSPQSKHYEAKDLKLNKYAKFGARDDKHLRRKMASSKVSRNSAIVVFENTEWDSEGKRFGGFWKSCLQLGIGGKFHQVYLDDISIKGISKSIENEYDQKTLVDETTRNNIPDFKEVLHGIMRSIDQGIPLVDNTWDAFPGYDSPKSKDYLKRISKQKLPLPSAKELQAMFTTNNIDTKGCIGPIDLFDGLDALMLKHLLDASVSWDFQKKIRISSLKDAGAQLHTRRISPKAQSTINGKLPATALLSSLLSIHVLYRMHCKDGFPKNRMFKSIEKSWKMLAKWCGFE